MPCILDPQPYAKWLDPGLTDPALFGDWLGPYPSEAVVAYQVSPLVNDARHEGPHCTQPLAPG